MPDRECHKRKLKELCRTRWVEWLESFWTFLELYEGIHDSLQAIGRKPGEWNASSVTDAKCLMLAITDFEFKISLVMAQKVLSYTEGITSSLQSKIIAAYEQVNAMPDSLREVHGRNVETYTIRNGVQLHTKKQKRYKVEPKIPRICGRQRNRHNVPAESPEEYYGKNLAVLFIDHLITELVTWFSSQQKQKAVSALYLVPSTAIVHEESLFNTFMQGVADLYQDDLPSPLCLQSELHCWYLKWKNSVSHPAQPLKH